MSKEGCVSDKYYTLGEVAERFRKTPRTVRRWIQEGRLEAVKVGGRILIPEKAVQSLKRPIEPDEDQSEDKAGRQQPDWGTATMSRRQILISLATTVAVEIMVTAGERIVGHEYREWLKRRTDEERAKELFWDLFGAPGRERHFYEGTHPDNLAAGRTLHSVFGMYDAKPIQMPSDSWNKISPDGDIVLVGGPNSTELTMIAWEFDVPNMRELDRDPNPIIPLRFFGISNTKSASLGRDRVGWNLEGVGPVSTVNWPYIDVKRGEELIIPDLGGGKIEVNEEDVYLPFENHLLVTRLPNFLSSKRQGHPSSWPQMLFFQANNGIGTRAAELLLQPAGLEALEHVKSKLQGATAFQALFRVYDPELTWGNFHRFRKIEPLDWAIEPLNIDDQTFERAHKKAIERMYDREPA